MFLSLINKIKDINARKFFILIISMLFLTDISIIFNIPGFREVLTTMYLTIVPGLLILIIINLNKLEFIKKFVLWIGLSLSMIMFLGLALNSLYPVIFKPLSLLPLFISFNTVIILLAGIAYKRNKKEFEIQRVFNFSVDVKDKLISPMIFAIVFPFLAIFGTYLMNTTGNNSILLVMLFLIPTYFIVLICLRNKISNSTYPFAIWMVSMSIFLMHGLTSNYLIGRDVHMEFFSFQYTLTNFHWDPSIYHNNVNSCLSITIVPTIYHVLTSIAGVYVFKVVFGLIGSIIPLIIYLISKKYIGNKYALFASLLLMFQMNFIELLGMARQEFAFLFFFLAVLILFDTDLTKKTKKILFLVFMLSVVLAHYSTAFVGLIMTVPILLIPFIKALVYEKKLKLTNFDILGILGILSLLWYFFAARSQMATAVSVVAKSSGSLTGVAVDSTRESTVLAVFGIGLKSTPQIISALVNDAIFLTIGIGLITVLLGYKYYKDKISPEFIVACIISTSLLVLFVVIPSISNDYGASRLFAQCLVFLAPIFVIGGMKIAKTIKKPKWDVFILIILLISLFTVSMHLNYEFYGIQSSIYYDNNANSRIETFIYDQDINGAQFISKYGGEDTKIYADTIAGSRLMAANNFSINNTDFVDFVQSLELNKTKNKNPYLYLSYSNTQKNMIFETVAPVYVTNSTTGYKLLNLWRSVIYDNGGSRVLIP